MRWRASRNGIIGPLVHKCHRTPLSLVRAPNSSPSTLGTVGPVTWFEAVGCLRASLRPPARGLVLDTVGGSACGGWGPRDGASPLGREGGSAARRDSGLASRRMGMPWHVLPDGVGNGHRWGRLPGALGLLAFLASLASIVRGGDFGVPRLVVFASVSAFSLACVAALWLTRRLGGGTHRVFLVLYLCLGAFSLVAIPPFATPDSYQQFCRAYEVSRGGFVSEIDHVDALDGGGSRGFGLLDAGLLVDGRSSGALTFDDVATHIGQQVDDGHAEAYEYSAMSLYSPVSFLPSAMGIFVARLFTRSLWVIVYAARASTLVFAGTLLYLSIRALPSCKDVIAGISLSPMLVELYASMSPDVVVYGGAVALFSYVLWLRHEGGREKVRLALLLPLMLLVALTKVVYLPICAFVLLIPGSCFGREERHLWWKLALVLGSVLLNVLWLRSATGYLIEYNQGVDAHAQLLLVFSQPLGYLLTVLRTILVSGGTWVLGAFGQQLNWLDVEAPTLLPLAFFVLVLTMLFKRGGQRRLIVTTAERVLVASIALIVCELIFTSLYLQWTPVGYARVLGIQGRYFLPVLPLVALAVASQKEEESFGWEATAILFLDLLILMGPLEAAL